MAEALREVTEDEVARFERDGVVCLRGVLSEDWLQRMEGAIERVLKTEVWTPAGIVDTGDQTT
jgi:hypothetical protein